MYNESSGKAHTQGNRNILRVHAKTKGDLEMDPVQVWEMKASHITTSSIFFTSEDDSNFLLAFLTTVFKVVVQAGLKVTT